MTPTLLVLVLVIFAGVLAWRLPSAPRDRFRGLEALALLALLAGVIGARAWLAPIELSRCAGLVVLAYVQIRLARVPTAGAAPLVIVAGAAASALAGGAETRALDWPILIVSAILAGQSVQRPRLGLLAPLPLLPLAATLIR